MSVRPYRDIVRRKSRRILVGSVPVGGDSPITVQTMTNTLTADAQATIDKLTAAVTAKAEATGADPAAVRRAAGPANGPCRGDRLGRQGRRRGQDRGDGGGWNHRVPKPI